ncbi:MAG TPA: hypothetical protein VKG78_02315 [Opitutaceae bacterium]|nr:hypothetical protein [Opitutaceae bacterium]
MLKLPTRLAATIGSLYAAILVISTEWSISPALHKIIIGVGTLIAAWGIHPNEAGVIAAGETKPDPDGAAQPASPPTLPV